MNISRVNVPVIKENGDFYRYYVADIPFCSNCQNYYISEFAAKRILHQVNQGSGERYSLKLANAQIRRGTISDDYRFYPTEDNNALIYNANEKQETNTTNNSEYNLNSKSFLGEMGYSVNLSADIRHKILVSAVNQHGKRRVADHIAFLIQTRLSQAGGKAKYLHAISIWQNDLNFIARLFID